MTSSTARQHTIHERTLLLAVGALEIAHVLVLCGLHRPILLSNLFQMVFPLLASALCLRHSGRGHSRLPNGSWLYAAFAFGLWALAQSVYLLGTCHPIPHFSGVGLDDVLWLLVGLPLLIAVNSQTEESDTVRWVDRVQILLFFAGLYTLVFQQTGRLSLSSAYLVQNLALLTCCVLRLPSCKSERERRFFGRLAAYLSLYAALESLGDHLYSHGWPIGSLVDTVWTIPFASFMMLLLWDSSLAKEDEELPSRVIAVIDKLHGVSVASLEVLSIGVSFLVTTRHPLLGGISLVCSFGMFAFRISAREDSWRTAHRQLESAVVSDALTGVGNRVLLRREVGKYLASKPTMGTALLFFVDLDRFKSINDTLGHEIGDCLLIEIARRLVCAAPVGSIVCRLGGDEFVVFTPDGGLLDAENTGNAFLDALRQPCNLRTHRVSCTASVGVVHVAADESIDTLLRIADHAMYCAKQLGKDQVQIFDPSLLGNISAQWKLETDLSLAIQQREIEVAFQPIVSSAVGEIIGFEALARWTHPVHGAIPPSSFIPLAEKTAAVTELGAHVLEVACEKVADWNHRWGTNLFASVNVSPRQLTDPNFLAVLLGTLERTQLRPELLKIEITESALLVDEDAAKRTLSAAREHGIHVSLDDFGTGYSSLSFLLSLPVDEIKVDRSFVSNMHGDPDRLELVRTIIQLGQALGKRTVAEGAETERDLRGLISMGCDYVQGWVIGRADTPSAWEQRFRSTSTTSTSLVRAAHGRDPDLPVSKHQMIKQSSAAIRTSAGKELGVAIAQAHGA